MTYRLVIELAGLPPTANGSHGHWKKAWTMQQGWKERARLQAFMQRPMSPLKKAKLICTRFSTSKPDRDNLAFSFKRVIDGLVAAGILEDDTDDVIIECQYLHEKTSPKKGMIRVEVEAV